ANSFRLWNLDDRFDPIAARIDRRLLVIAHFVYPRPIRIIDQFVTSVGAPFPVRRHDHGNADFEQLGHHFSPVEWCGRETEDASSPAYFSATMACSRAASSLFRW